MSAVVRAVFPWRGWGAQPCLVCSVPLDIAESVSEHDADGRLLGFRHAEDCA